MRNRWIAAKPQIAAGASAIPACDRARASAPPQTVIRLLVTYGARSWRPGYVLLSGKSPGPSGRASRSGSVGVPTGRAHSAAIARLEGRRPGQRTRYGAGPRAWPE